LSALHKADYILATTRRHQAGQRGLITVTAYQPVARVTMSMLNQITPTFNKKLTSIIVEVLGEVTNLE
jgi:hypothetical protein